MSAGASPALTQGCKSTLLPSTGPSPLRPSGQEISWLTVRNWKGVGWSSRRLGLLVPVLSDYSLGWQQVSPKPEGMFEVTRGGGVSTSGLKISGRHPLYHGTAGPGPALGGSCLSLHPRYEPICPRGLLSSGLRRVEDGC